MAGDGAVLHAEEGNHEQGKQQQQRPTSPIAPHRDDDDDDGQSLKADTVGVCGYNGHVVCPSQNVS